MKRRDFLNAGAVAASTAVIAAPAIAQGKIEWNMPTSFPAKAPGIGTNVTTFANRVNEMSDGKLTIKVFSGGELVPPFEVEDAVSQGTAPIGHSTPYYNAGKNSAYHFFSSIPFGMTAVETQGWLRYGGGQELWDEIYARSNLVPFASGNSNTQAAGWFRNPINSVKDFSGLNMRIAGLGGEVMRKLGVNSVLLPPPEIFPSFQSGAIDATEWVGPMLDQAFGLQKVAKYCYLPAFHEPSAVLEVVVNKDAWNELSPSLKAVIRNVADAAYTENMAQFDYFNATAYKSLEAEGVIFGTFSDDILRALRKATTEVMIENATTNPDFAKVMESYDKTLKLFRDYGTAMKQPLFRFRA